MSKAKLAQQGTLLGLTYVHLGLMVGVYGLECVTQNPSAQTGKRQLTTSINPSRSAGAAIRGTLRAAGINLKARKYSVTLTASPF